MKILVVDKEDLTSQLMLSKLTSKGHEVTMESNKNKALDLMGEEWFDCVMLDPAPLSESRPIIHAIWKNIKTDAKPYMILLSKNEEMTTANAILSCNNDFLLKPLDMEDIEDKLASAERFLDVFKYLEEEDNTPSIKGMINKDAFYQLFLSSLDRAYRYGERSLMVFIHINNYDDIKASVKEDMLEQFNQKIAEKMTLMRRQSDVVGRIGEKDYAILLQRPQYETEPLDAMNRFCEVLDRFYYEFVARDMAPKFELDLIEIPQGILHSRKETPFELDEESVVGG